MDAVPPLILPPLPLSVLLLPTETASPCAWMVAFCRVIVASFWNTTPATVPAATAWLVICTVALSLARTPVAPRTSAPMSVIRALSARSIPATEPCTLV